MIKIQRGNQAVARLIPAKNTKDEWKPVFPIRPLC